MHWRARGCFLDDHGQFYATFRLRPGAEPLSRGILPEFGYWTVARRRGVARRACAAHRYPNRTPYEGVRSVEYRCAAVALAWPRQRTWAARRRLPRYRLGRTNSTSTAASKTD